MSESMVGDVTLSPQNPSENINNNSNNSKNKKKEKEKKFHSTSTYRVPTICQVLFLVPEIYQKTKQIPDFREIYSSRGSILQGL